MRFPLLRQIARCFWLAAAVGRLIAAEAGPSTASSAGAIDDPATAMRKFSVAPGLKIGLFASEPLIQNVVSFAFDEHGRCYVVETGRRRTSVFDIRNHKDWLDDDFSLRTVEDRVGFYKRTLPPPSPSKGRSNVVRARARLADYSQDGSVDWRDLEVESERIRLLVDTNHDGHVDAATTLAEGFDSLVSGVAAGVLARQGAVWFTCVPDLWKLSSDDLRAKSGLPAFTSPANPHRSNPQIEIRNLLHGFGVHIAFGGHDLHGLKLGPDGKIYFSIADRGTSTNLWSRIVDHWPGLTMEALADSGAVFRCNPDGGDFEVVAIGLRNPQELAFDEFGNLFTGDNNGDGGDKARWEYIVEGADYGWRIGWQWLPRMGAWNSEMLWGLEPTNTSRYYLPPVAHIGAGPSGVTYHPGTGLSARYERHFFMCDFRGGPNSVVHSFALRSKGAGFEAYDPSEVVSGFLCTDVDFGTDGALYVSDWVKGWEKTARGRIYRLFDPATIDDAALNEVRTLLADGMQTRSNAQLAALLGHRDMRVRLDAQLALAAKGRSAVPILEAITTHTAKAASRLARIHATWALGQIASAERARGLVATATPTGRALHSLLLDADPELRGQSIRMLANARGLAWPDVAPRLNDPDERVRFMAALALGRVEAPSDHQAATAELLTLLRKNNDRDAYLRHAVVLALARIGDVALLSAAAHDASAAVRLGVCLAMRRLQRPEIAQFLGDDDPRVVLECARAIHDGPIPAALPALARLGADGGNALSAAASLAGHTAVAGERGEGASVMATAVARRVLNAHFRLGQPENARVLAAFAANENAPAPWRSEALELLAQWPTPAPRDHVVGLWRPLPPRASSVAAAALQAVMARIATNASPPVQLAALQAGGALGLQQSDAFSVATDRAAAPELRVESLRALARMKDARLREAIRVAAADSNEVVRVAAARLQANAGSARELGAVLEKASVAEKQAALASLAGARDRAAARLLGSWLEKLVAGQVPPELQLDVLQAVSKNPALAASPRVQSQLRRLESTRDPNDPLAKWRDCLYGGDAEEGRKTFIERQDAACFRCHKIKGEGGDVGPELAGIGSRKSREYILESMLSPNKEIAPGFENVLVTMKDGASYAGLLKAEDDVELVVNSPEDGVLKLRKAEVQTRERGLSAMPEGLAAILSKNDLRNLVEFISTLK